MRLFKYCYVVWYSKDGVFGFFCCRLFRSWLKFWGKKVRVLDLELGFCNWGFCVWVEEDVLLSVYIGQKGAFGNYMDCSTSGEETKEESSCWYWYWCLCRLVVHLQLVKFVVLFVFLFDCLLCDKLPNNLLYFSMLAFWMIFSCLWVFVTRFLRKRPFYLYEVV